jgi:hypothetical protein
MITDRHVEVYRLRRIHGCTLQETGEMLDPPVTAQRVHQLLDEVYEEIPDLRPSSIVHEIISYDESMDFKVQKTF